MPYAPTDWNVHLGIAPPPEGTLDESQLPAVEPYGGVQLSQWGEVPLETATEFYRMAAIRRKEQEAAREAAIRWQGEKQYEQMIARGASPEEAFQKTAHLMYYNHPAGIGSLMRATAAKAAQDFGPARAEDILDADGNVVGKGVRNPNTGAIHVLRPPAVQEGEFQTEEIVPGVIGVRREGGRGFKLINTTTRGGELTPAKRLELAAKLPTILYNMTGMDKKSQEYQISQQVVDAIQGSMTPASKPVTVGSEKPLPIFGIPIQGGAPFEKPSPPTAPVDSRGVGAPLPGAVNPVKNVGPLTMPTSAPPVAATAPAPAAAPLLLPPFTNAPVAPPELGGPVDVDPKLQKIINMQKDEQRILRMMDESQKRKAVEAPKAPEQPVPMPKAKSELVKGQLYVTPRGVARWDGEKFVKE